jgi:hypothetical protein
MNDARNKIAKIVARTFMLLRLIGKKLVAWGDGRISILTG